MLFNLLLQALFLIQVRADKSCTREHTLSVRWDQRVPWASLLHGRVCICNTFKYHPKQRRYDQMTPGVSQAFLLPHPAKLLAHMFYWWLFPSPKYDCLCPSAWAKLGRVIEYKSQPYSWELCWAILTAQVFVFCQKQLPQEASELRARIVTRNVLWFSFSNLVARLRVSGRQLKASSSMSLLGIVMTANRSCICGDMKRFAFLQRRENKETWRPCLFLLHRGWL